MKKQYNLGEKIDFLGVKLVCIADNQYLCRKCYFNTLPDSDAFCDKTACTQFERNDNENTIFILDK